MHVVVDLIHCGLACSSCRQNVNNTTDDKSETTLIQTKNAKEQIWKISSHGMVAIFMALIHTLGPEPTVTLGSTFVPEMQILCLGA